VFSVIKDMNIQSSIFTSALQQPTYSATERTVGSPQTENESVSTRPVEKVIKAEGSEPLIMGGRLDVFA